MSRMPFRTAIVLSIVLLVCPAVSIAEGLKAIPLPKPQTDGGKPLMQALKERKSSRSFGGDTLSSQTLSNLLWAAFGVNRPDSGKRTAPSAVNWQEIDVYVARADGVFLYNAKKNALEPVVAQDLRGLTGAQPFVAQAPVNLVYVADSSKTDEEMGEGDRTLFSAADVGFIAQNVYLYCASEGLATVVRGMIDRSTLAKAMKLRPEQKVMLAQTVGYPKKK